MKKIKISKDLIKICPEIQLGCINYATIVEKENKDLWDVINKEIENIKENMTMEELYSQKNIADARNLYKALGKDPHRYRVSSEALIRRIIQGKGLYKINNVVDSNNLISIITKLSVGSYDIDKLGENLEFRIGKEGENYKGIGKDIINIEKLPVFSDENGPYGSPTSDSERAMITSNTQNVLTVLISFSSNSNLDKYMNEAVEILEKYAGAKNIETLIIK